MKLNGLFLFVFGACAGLLVGYFVFSKRPESSSVRFDKEKQELLSSIDSLMLLNKTLVFSFDSISVSSAALYASIDSIKQVKSRRDTVFIEKIKEINSKNIGELAKYWDNEFN
jgi:hypothetical protein